MAVPLLVPGLPQAATLGCDIEPFRGKDVLPRAAMFGIGNY
jgi:hypothetical protein